MLKDKEKKEAEDKKEAEKNKFLNKDQNMHPSWLAKIEQKQEQHISIFQPQGKKIKLS